MGHTLRLARTRLFVSIPIALLRETHMILGVPVKSVMARVAGSAVLVLLAVALPTPASAQSEQDEFVAPAQDPSGSAEVIDYTEYHSQDLESALEVCEDALHCPLIDSLTDDEFTAFCVQTLECLPSVEPMPVESVREESPLESMQTEMPPVLVEQLNVHPPFYYGWHANQGVSYSICSSTGRCNVVGGVRLGVVIWLEGRSVKDFRMSIDPDRGPAVSGKFSYRCTWFLAGAQGCDHHWNIPVFWDCYDYTAGKCESPREVKWGHPNGTFYWSHKWSWTAQGHGAIRWNLPHPGDANTPFYRCGSSPNDCHFNL